MTPREQKKRAAWHAIQQAALRLFDEHGYRETTIEQIAAAANVSRATFFNYFSSKEAVVFDPAPDARDHWQATMDAQSGNESLQQALSTILLDFAESLRDRMELQRRMKAETPALAASTQDFGNQFHQDLHAWTARHPSAAVDPLQATLRVNVAIAALTTAYQTWPAEESFDDFMGRLQTCLKQVG